MICYPSRLKNPIQFAYSGNFVSKQMSMSAPFVIIPPTASPVPMILSVPHCGTAFPKELQGHFVPKMMEAPDDTDWFVHELYNFASELGITIIHAHYSRWVIDLNRDPESKPLYDDGRIITALTTTTDFFGTPIYTTPEFEPNAQEVERRRALYYAPYHEKIDELLAERKARFGKVLLWDAHSIRHKVPTIQEAVFPDMILGDNDERTAHPRLIESALQNLSSGPFGVNHNHPFKGGQITRSFGKPEENVHALQLEMNKILYMDDLETSFHPERAERMRAILRKTFHALLDTLAQL